MIADIQRLGRTGLMLFAHVGRSGLFLFSTLVRKPKIRKSFPLLIDELYMVGVFSLMITKRICFHDR